MNAECSICCAIFQSSDELCSPLCGHVFHFGCLSQWLERSKTCPHCRQKTNCSQVHRLYIQTGDNLTQSEDLAVIRKKLKNLKSQMRLKNKRLKNIIVENEALKKQLKDTEDYRAEVILKNKRLKNIIVENKALKKQLKDKKESWDNNELTPFPDLNAEMERFAKDYKKQVIKLANLFISKNS